MLPADRIRYAWTAVNSSPRRTLLVLAAMAIGVAAVVLLGAIGEGTRRFIIGEFSSLGSNLLIVLPGRAETTGGHPPLLGETPRDLTLDDALALRRIRAIRHIAPVVVGSAPVSWGGLEREVTIVGSTSELKPVRDLQVRRGRFLPAGDPHLASPVCTIGEKVRRELFRGSRALGQWLRIGNRRCRVIGVLASKGQALGLDVDDMVVVPVALAQALFDRPGLFRILLQLSDRMEREQAIRAVRRLLKERHEGEEDVTVISQESMIAAFDRILQGITYAVSAIAGISLVVAGILIMNVMLIVVTRRTAEIGLLMATGASRREVLKLFLTEALLLSLLGGLSGGLLGVGAVWLGQRLWPVFPLAIPWWALPSALGVALGAGALFGLLPAWRAARLQPVKALAPR